jgi:hypothetical protein
MAKIRMNTRRHLRAVREKQRAYQLRGRAIKGWAVADRIRRQIGLRPGQKPRSESNGHAGT